MDEQALHTLRSVYYSIEDMNLSGLRHWYPYWGNFDRTVYGLSDGRIGHKYLGCGEQEEYVKDKLKKNPYNDEWDVKVKRLPESQSLSGPWLGMPQFLAGMAV